MSDHASPPDWGFLFENSMDGILLMDASGAILDVNPPGCHLLGYSREELLRLTTRDIVAPEDYASHRERLRSAGLTDVAPQERRLRHQDGTIFSVECWTRALADGRVVGFMRALQHLPLTERAGSSERWRAEAALRRNERLFRALTEKATDLISILGPEGTFRYVSPSVERLLGYTPDSLTGRHVMDLVHPQDQSAIQATFEEIVAPGEPLPAEVRCRHRDGTWRTFEWTRTSRLDDPDIRGVVINARDVTERRHAEDALRHSEERLRHAQRMESIGRLAGGVAHDFNNLLTVILAYSDQQIARLEPGHPLMRPATEIHRAAERAARLTRQLLAFSRRQVLEPRVLDLAAVLTDLGPMLQRLIGEDVDLLIHAEPGAALVRADPGQIEQVIMNLAVNARDAMPGGGRLTIATGQTVVDAEQVARFEGLAPGFYVTLAVSDSGVGMDSEVRAKLFEPFFTTKERGEGTGLGLATVYGIVQQSGGAIDVESAPGAGAVFTILLPRVAEGGVDLPRTAPATGSGRGTETVLLAEDDQVVRDLMVELLREAGYQVHQAPGGREALDLAATLPDPIHLLVTDVVMPEMSGRELARQLAATRPGLRVLYVSGYTRDLVARHGVLEAGVHLLQKPFGPEVLVRKVREVLDTPDRDAA